MFIVTDLVSLRATGYLSLKLISYEQTVQALIRRFAVDPDGPFCDILSGSALFVNVLVNGSVNFETMVNTTFDSLLSLYDGNVQKNYLRISPLPHRDAF